MTHPLPPRARLWARVRQSGAHGLRRGAWYPVVNDNQASLVVLNVRRDNVPVPREMLELSDQPPQSWSVVQWEESQRGASRASERNYGLTYAVCPSCCERSGIERPGAKEMKCAHCQRTFPVDWERLC